MNKLQSRIRRIVPVDASRSNLIQIQLDSLVKPTGSLGRLEELAKKYCLITGRNKPTLGSRIIFTCAADHGVSVEQVCACPREVTAQMVRTVLRGQAAVNVLARQADARVIVIDMGVDHEFGPAEGLENRKIGNGTRNMARGPAMSREEAERSVLAGIEVVEKYRRELDIVGVGCMGIGNAAAALAIVSTLAGAPVDRVANRTAGGDDKTSARNTAVVTQSLAVNEPDPADPVGVLAGVGGYEIGCVAGLVLGAALHRIPVVLDGFASAAGALIAAALKPEVRGYIIASPESAEMGHRTMLERLEQVPLFDLTMKAGDGAGAALGISLVDAGLRILSEMTTFAVAGVAKRNEEPITRQY